MFEIKDLLGKFKNVENPREVREKIALAINSVLRADFLKGDDVEYKDHCVRIKTNPAVRHRVFVSKADCLAAIKGLLPGHTIVDIR